MPIRQTHVHPIPRAGPPSTQSLSLSNTLPETAWTLIVRAACRVPLAAHAYIPPCSDDEADATASKTLCA